MTLGFHDKNEMKIKTWMNECINFNYWKLLVDKQKY